MGYIRKLGKYGIKIKKNMEENYQARFQELVINETVMERLLAREDEIINKKHKLEKELMLKYPKPITNEFLVIAKYNQMIEVMAEELLQEEIEEII